MDPHTIASQQFSVTMRGYAREEVDDFLDQVEQWGRALETELAEVRGRYERLANGQTQVMPPVPPTPTEQAGKLLELAQRMSDDLVLEAKDKAAAIILTADDEARRKRQEAEAEKERIVQSGHDERHKEIGRLEEQRAKLQQKVDELNSARHKVQTLLGETLTKVMED